MTVKDLRNIEWNNLNSTSTGMIPKFIDNEIFMKLSTYNETIGFHGEEPGYEELTYQIGKLLKLNVVEVKVEQCIIRYNKNEYKTLVAISPNYNKDGNSIPIENFCEINGCSSKDLLLDNRFKKALELGPLDWRKLKDSKETIFKLMFKDDEIGKIVINGDSYENFNGYIELNELNGDIGEKTLWFPAYKKGIRFFNDEYLKYFVKSRSSDETRPQLYQKMREIGMKNMIGYTYLCMQEDKCLQTAYG